MSDTHDYDFQIDGVAMTIQPMEVTLNPIQATPIKMTGGGHNFAIPEKGVKIRATWGREWTDAVPELNTKRNSLVSHSFRFTDPNGTVHGPFTMGWLGDVIQASSFRDLFKRTSIEFLESA